MCVFSAEFTLFQIGENKQTETKTGNKYCTHFNTNWLKTSKISADRSEEQAEHFTTENATRVREGDTVKTLGRGRVDHTQLM